jgi:uncharacterized membrane protein
VSAESRVVFVDLLRFVAALQMLQGHTIAALLAPTARQGAWFAVWTAARGLTSVAFLFAAGLSFYLATERGGDARASRRRIRRALRLIALGYLLHLPLAALFTADPALRLRALREFAAVDVLQCIGVSLLLLEGLREVRGRALICAGLGCFCLALAPLAAAMPVAGNLHPLLSYLGPRGGSLFPLSPWAAHVLFGFACGWLVREPMRLGLVSRLVALSALGFAIYGLCAGLGAALVIGEHVLRLSWVLLASSALCWLGARLGQPPAWLLVLARNTLLLYVFHVLLVYGQGVGLASLVGPILGPGGALLAALGVIAASAAVALTGERLARARRTG